MPREWYSETIREGVNQYCISRASSGNHAHTIAYGEDITMPKGHIFFTVYWHSGQIWLSYSLNEGKTGTWVHKQVTTDGYTKQQCACCVDQYGNGLDIAWLQKGRGSTSYQLNHYSVCYKHYDFWTDTFGDEEVVLQAVNTENVGFYSTVDVASDVNGNVHLVSTYAWNWNPYFGRFFYCSCYRKRDSYSGTWDDDVAWFMYGRAGQPEHRKPSITVDFYGNPHIVCIVAKPLSNWNTENFTSCWWMNLDQGLMSSWPNAYMNYINNGSNHGYMIYRYFSELVNMHIICNKYRGAPGGTPSPGDTAAPSWYARESHAHFTSNGLCYYDGANEYDYPFFVFHHDNYGWPSEPDGTFYQYRDDFGWHEELLLALGLADNPSIALSPDGHIHTLAKKDGYYRYNYYYRNTPDGGDGDTGAWGGPVTTPPYCYAERHLVQRYPVQYPKAGMPCAPFEAVVFEDSMYKLKLFFCRPLGGAGGDYGIIM